MAENKMQLYVWDQFAPDYSDGLAFAIAESLSDAQVLVAGDDPFQIPVSDWGPVTIHDLDKPFFKSVTGGS